MYKRSVTAPAVRGQLCFVGAIFLVTALLIYLRTVPGARSILGLLPLIACGLFLIGVAFWQSRHAVIVDENGVRANIGRNKGNIPWDNVGEIGIISTAGGKRTFYIVSKSASPYIGSAALAFSKPSDDLIKVGYNKELLEAIEKHYSGPIWGKKEPKVDTKE
jgi:hypothetical protein